MNIDAKENEVIISIKKETMPIVVNIIAVDRCGTKSAIRSKPIPILSIPGGLGNSSGTSATSCTCTKELASSITVTLFFSLMAVVISVLITRKMSKGPDSIPKDDDEMVSILIFFGEHHDDNFVMHMIFRIGDHL